MTNRCSCCSGQKKFFPTKPSSSQLSRWDSDEKMDEIPDDGMFLRKMKDSEVMQIFKREDNRLNNLNRGEKINPFTSVCVEFFGKLNSCTTETMFNPASCLRVNVDTKWITTRRISFSDDDEQEEKEEKDSEEEEASDEPMKGEDDSDEGLLDWLKDACSVGNEDGEKKKTLKRKNPDGGEDGGCKDAKREKDSEDPEEKKTLERKN